MLAAEYLHSNSKSNEMFDTRLHELLAIFQQLKNINNHKQNYVKLLELSCIFLSSEIAREDTQSTTP